MSTQFVNGIIAALMVIGLLSILFNSNPNCVQRDVGFNQRVCD